MAEEMQIRKLTAEHDLEQYNDLLRYAFQVTEKQLLDYGWENEDIRQSKMPVLEKARVIGWFDQGHLASQFAVYPLKEHLQSYLPDRVRDQRRDLSGIYRAGPDVRADAAQP